MSYPHAMNFENIWNLLKTKFFLIIVLDQAKTKLLDQVRKYDYQVKEFTFKGQKSFFYYVSTARESESSSDEDYYCTMDAFQSSFEEFNDSDNMHTDMFEFSCEKGLHQNWFSDVEDPVCTEKVNITLKCGHTYKTKCFQSEDEGIICEQKMVKKCDRKIHWKMVPCNEELICEETFQVTLDCSHSIHIKCHQDTKEIMKSTVCRIKTRRLCLHNLHEYTLPCFEKVSCDKLCLKKAPCGHSFLVKCDNLDQMILDRCEKPAIKSCPNELHKYSGKCSMTLKCCKKFKVPLSCGHFKIFTCHEINLKDGKVVTCEKIPCRGRFSFNILSKPLKLDRIQGPATKRVCDHSGIGICLALCNKLLKCGHLCQRMCGDCLNSRLHGKCTIDCQKMLSCSHGCGASCHLGKCHCKVNCKDYLSQQTWQATFKMSDFYVEKWRNLVSSLHEDTSEEVRNIFKKLTYQLKERRFAKVVLKNYKKIFKYCQEIVQLHNAFLGCQFSQSLRKYRDAIAFSVECLLKWVDPNGKTLSDLDLNDFKMELERIRHLFVVCVFRNKSEQWIFTTGSSEIVILLDKLLNSKYDNNVKLYFQLEIDRICLRPLSFRTF